MRNLLIILGFGASLCFAQAVACQTLTATNSTGSPADSASEGGVAFVRAIGAFNFAASGGSVTITSVMLTVGGNGNWSTDIDQTDGVQLWTDNGDLTFSTSLDTLTGSAPGASPTATIGLGGGVNVPSGSSVVLWVVLRVTATAGASVPETFSCSIATAADVAVSGPATVQLGAPAPQSSTLSVVTFFVTTFFPTAGGGGRPITVTGSGFTSPVTITIGGYPCPGTASVTPDGTQITGLTTPSVPDGTHAIVITTGLLGPKTISQTFSPGGEGGKTGNSCQTSESFSFGGALILLCLAAAWLRWAIRPSAFTTCR